MSKLDLDEWNECGWRDGGNDYNWEEAFVCANGSVSCIPGHECPLVEFDLDDVERVIASSAGENDGQHWIALVELADGRLCFVSAWCDYTGWDCRSGGSAVVCRDLDAMLRLGLDQDDRSRLGLRLSS